MLSGKYFVDEAYDWLIARPLYWISDRVFLKLGDQKLFDGSLHGLAALGRRTAGGLSRVQNGNLHLVRAARAVRHHRLPRVELAHG